MTQKVKNHIEIYNKHSETHISVFTKLPLCRFFVDLKRLSDPALRDHLQLDSPSKPDLSIQTFPYESAYTELQAICAALGPKDKVWICDKASCALTQVIPKVREHFSLLSCCVFLVNKFDCTKMRSHFLY